MKASKVSSVILLMKTQTATVASQPTRNEAMGKNEKRDKLKNNKNIVHIDDAINPCLTFSKVKLARIRMAGKF
eukprot:15346060-Ditylum_brightwellii.AAC.1